MQIEPKPPTAKGPDDWFTGDVFLDVIARGEEPSRVRVMAVRFTPSARTAWHSHAVGQTLYVTEGRGLIQARGGEINEIRAGDIITTPGGGLRLAIRDATVRAYQQPRFAEGGIRHSLRMTDNIPVDRTEAADAARQPSRAPCSGGGPAATAAPVPVTETAANRQLPS